MIFWSPDQFTVFQNVRWTCGPPPRLSLWPAWPWAQGQSEPGAIKHFQKGSTAPVSLGSLCFSPGISAVSLEVGPSSPTLFLHPSGPPQCFPCTDTEYSRRRSTAGCACSARRSCSICCHSCMFPTLYWSSIKGPGRDSHPVFYSHFVLTWHGCK